MKEKKCIRVLVLKELVIDRELQITISPVENLNLKAAMVR